MENIQELQEIEQQILQTLADNNINKAKTAKELFMHRNTLEYRMNKIREKTGLAPCIFWDLVELLGLTAEGKSETRTEAIKEYDKKLSIRCARVFDMPTLALLMNIRKNIMDEMGVTKDEV